MQKISNEVLNFIKKTIKTWTVELISGGKNLAEAKIQSDKLQENALSPLLFVSAIRPLHDIHRKCTAGY